MLRPWVEFPTEMSNPLDHLTVAITNFRRPEFLTRCLRSVLVAGCRRVVVASVEPDEHTREIIEGFRGSGWLSFDVAYAKDDIGCNDTWQLAAYHSRTKRIIILHDDDTLNAEFGKAYTETIAPAMDRDPTLFATWRADLLFTDGRHEPTDFWSGPTRIQPSRDLLKVVAARKRLSLSPIISVFDRQTVIHACKEAQQALVHPDCYHRPGMLLGTEIVAYMRHIQKYPKWLYVDKVLSHYGSHEGSGTIRAQEDGHMQVLWAGYDRARAQSELPKPVMPPRIIFVYYENAVTDPDELARNAVARYTWDYHFSQGRVIEMPVQPGDLLRSSAPIKDTRIVPFFKDLFEWGVAHAMPEDIVVYCNRDIGLTSQAVPLLIQGVARGRGVTCCPRRWLHPKPGRMYLDLVNCRPDGGFDAFAVTPAWWQGNRDKLPDMLIGREAWDTVFRAVAEEWADQSPRARQLAGNPAAWLRSKAYTDHVCWHRSHQSNWIQERLTAPGQLLNRRLAREFFLTRNNMDLVKQLS